MSYVLEEEAGDGQGSVVIKEVWDYAIRKGNFVYNRNTSAEFSSESMATCLSKEDVDDDKIDELIKIIQRGRENKRRKLEEWNRLFD
jgi:hypothetical protein